jgi:hypothetical protein
MNEPNLQLRLTDRGVSSAFVPISWCVDKEWLVQYQIDNSKTSECSYKKYSEPYICFLTVPICFESHKKSMQWKGFAKLTDSAAYVRFCREGNNRIFANIVYGTNGVYYWMENKCIRRCFHSSNDWNETYVELNEFIEREKSIFIDVNVPAGVFGKEPPKWLKTIVNFFYSSEAYDTCSFRKRFLALLLLSPIVVVAIITVAFVNFLLLSLWIKNSLADAINVEITNPPTIWKYPIVQKFPLIVVSRLTLIIAGIVGWGRQGTAYILPYMGWALAGLIVASLGIYLVQMVINYFKNIGSVPEPNYTPDLISNEFITNCDPIVSMKNIPNKTIKLYYEEVKGKICKPFRK